MSDNNGIVPGIFYSLEREKEPCTIETTVLGEGTYSRVHRARTERSLKRFVVKKIREENITGLPLDDLDKKQFAAEPIVLQHVNSPYVPKMIGIVESRELGMTQNTCYALEDAPGKHLIDYLLPKNRPFSFANIKDSISPFDRLKEKNYNSTTRRHEYLIPTLHALGNIAEAVHAFHEQGLVHRDVSLVNCLRTKEGKGTLIDAGTVIGLIAPDPFTSYKCSIEGINKCQDATSSACYDEEGTISTTTATPAPEQLKETSHPYQSSAVDIYSLSATAHLALTATAHLPRWNSIFKSGMYLATTRSQKPPVPACQQNPELPSALGELLLKGLSQPPGERPKAKELAEGFYKAEEEIRERTRNP